MAKSPTITPRTGGGGRSSTSEKALGHGVVMAARHEKLKAGAIFPGQIRTRGLNMTLDPLPLGNRGIHQLMASEPTSHVDSSRTSLWWHTDQLDLSSRGYSWGTWPLGWKQMLTYAAMHSHESHAVRSEELNLPAPHWEQSLGSSCREASVATSVL